MARSLPDEAPPQSRLEPIAGSEAMSGVGTQASEKRTAVSMISHLSMLRPSNLFARAAAAPSLLAAAPMPQSRLPSQAQGNGERVLPRQGRSRGQKLMRRRTTNLAPVRLVIVRHAQSANKGLASGQRSSSNPALTDLGHEQSEALARRMLMDFGPPGSDRAASLLVVSSPMRRCLLTIEATVLELKLTSDACYCHGACFEYGCAGTKHRGSLASDIKEEFPQFETINFNENGLWDYRGETDKEVEHECRQRGERVAEWLKEEASWMALSRARGGETATIVLCIHQTFSDLLCHILLEGSSKGWEYGDVSYPLKNACMHEIVLHPDGSATMAAPSLSRYTSLRPRRGC